MIDIDKVERDWKKGESKECSFITYKEAARINREDRSRDPNSLTPYEEMRIWDGEYYSVEFTGTGYIVERQTRWFINPKWIKTIKGHNDEIDSIFDKLIGTL